MRADAGVARLDPATDATFPDAKAEDLPAAVLYQRSAPPGSPEERLAEAGPAAPRAPKERQEHRRPLVAHAG
jgi:hypothetical protein